MAIPFPTESITSEELGDLDFAYLMGWYLAEGTLARRYDRPGFPYSKLILTLGSSDSLALEKIKSILNNIGVEPYILHNYQGAKATRVEIMHQPLVDACLKHLGRGAKGKFFSGKISEPWKKPEVEPATYVAKEQIQDDVPTNTDDLPF
jgi:hypothetical protein